MKRRLAIKIPAILVAVLMIVQYGVMPLLHAGAHRADANHHAKALSEENCAFAKVAEAPLQLADLPLLCLNFPTLVRWEPVSILPILKATSIGPASSRGPPQSA